MQKTGIESFDYSWNPITGCYFLCPYCVSEDTEILMSDFSIKQIKNINIGDKIVGINDEMKYHHLVQSMVIGKWSTEKMAYEITAENEMKLICSGEHQWLSNRGWKFTTGEMVGKNQRPYLTVQNRLPRVYLPLQAQFIETDDFKKGYLHGLIDGDGVFKIYDESYGISRQFRIVMEDDAPLIRATEYLKYFGVDVKWFKHSPGFNGSRSNGIRTSDKERFEKIKSLIDIEKTLEFLRGYVSGFFDSEGSNSQVIRMGDTKEHHQEIVINGLKIFNFDYIKENQERPQERPGKAMYKIRIRGGIKEIIRFIQVFNPANTHRRNVKKTAIKDLSKIKSIRPLGIKAKMIDIQTSSGNFIANGFIAHNCYAPKLAALQGDYDFKPTFHPERLHETAKLKAGIIFQGSAGEAFGEWVSRDWIDQVIAAEHENPRVTYMNLTKNPKRYAELVEGETDNLEIKGQERKPIIMNRDKHIWLGTTLDLGYSSPKAPSVQERLATINLLEYPRKWLSIEPFAVKMIDEYKKLLSSLNVQWILIGVRTKPLPVLSRQDYSIIESFVKWLGENRIPVFVKNSIVQHDKRPYPTKWPRAFPLGVKLATKNVDLKTPVYQDKLF